MKQVLDRVGLGSINEQLLFLSFRENCGHASIDVGFFRLDERRELRELARRSYGEVFGLDGVHCWDWHSCD